jgi:L-threonylcarbamoyladenylate synthase
LVALPTETVYGLAANALDARAVARIFEAKQRPHFDPLIVHIASPDDLPTVASDWPRAALRLAQRFWPGPLTLVLPKQPAIPDLVTSGLPSVAVRVPDHPVALALIREAGVPLAAPSANPFGYLSPTTADHVRRQLGAAVDFVLDGGPCRVGVESTILGWRGETPVLLRAGGLPLEEIEREAGPVARPQPGEVVARPDAPGQLPQHYAPRTPLRIVESSTPSVPRGRRVGWIGLVMPRKPRVYVVCEALSPSGDLREAAAALFAALHRLDQLGLDEIHAELVPAAGLGLAINDRFRRAATLP